MLSNGSMMPRLTTLTFVVLCTGLVACTVKKRERGERSDPPAKSSSESKEAKAEPADFGPAFSVVKELLLSDPKSCFLTDVAVCLDDDEVIAEALANVMKRTGVTKRIGTELPSDGKALKYVLPKVQQAYRLAQQATEPRRDAIERRIEQRYGKPVVRQEGSRVVADHGFLPGPIEPYRNGFRLHDSPLGNGRSWRASEISRFLGELAAKYPDAKSLQLRVKAPNFGSFQTLKMTYNKAVDRIRFNNQTTDTNYYLSKKLNGDFSNLSDRGISLATNKMHSCSTRAPELGGPCTPPLD